jgi:hypothetical protein
MAVVVAQVEGKFMNKVTRGWMVETKKRYLARDANWKLGVGVEKRGRAEFFGLLGLGISKQWFAVL